MSALRQWRRRSLGALFLDRTRDIRLSKAGHALGGDVAQQQSDAKQQHQSGGPEFDATHQQCTAALAAGADPPRQPFCGDRNDGNGRNGDRGAKPHYERGGDAGPEHSLRQREYQNQNGAGTGPDADGENRAETAPPAAGTGELCGLWTMGMSAMLVVDMAVIVMLRMLVSRHVVASDSCWV